MDVTSAVFSQIGLSQPKLQIAGSGTMLVSFRKGRRRLAGRTYKRFRMAEFCYAW
jgi:hypothetical protein